MSRSYKKHPIIKDGSKGRVGRSMKSYAQRAVRNCDELPTRAKGAYKKVFESYDISDWSFRYTYDDAVKDWEREEIEYPRHREYFCYHFENDKMVRDAEPRRVDEEEGPLHKKYKTLNNYLNYIKKTYYRK